MHPLWRPAARIHATQEYDDRYAIPLWHRP